MLSGELIAAIAMTEPGAGSDLQGIRTTRRRRRATTTSSTAQKTFITNGIIADLVIVVARTDPDAGHQGISCSSSSAAWTGFERGRNLDKIGLHAQDTAELFFDRRRACRRRTSSARRAPGFVYLMTNLPQERLSIAASAVAACEASSS